MYIEESKENHKLKEAKNIWKGLFDPFYPDTQRHWHLIRSSLSAVQACNPDNLLTLGDNTGRDAAFFKRYLYNNPKIISSDLDSQNLNQVKKMGFIDEYIDCDVEKIPYPDNSIDVIVGKETYHHWPRPMLGLYECLRVAKKLVILIEPHDDPREVYKPPYPKGDEFRNNYEKIGNYKYCVSIREFEKVISALYLPGLLLKGINDPYEMNQDFEEYLKKYNHLQKLAEEGKRHFNLMMIGIPKNQDIYSTLENLKKYHSLKRAINPYKE